MCFFISRALGNHSVAEALRNAGACVEIQGDHFAADEQDAVWLSEVALRNWIILTKDQNWDIEALLHLPMYSSKQSYYCSCVTLGIKYFFGLI
ncbi:MAG: hypothetical protein JOZ78_13775 [Chroococcidiopsidaceae cyanobacterium CP_BM_ER_R8_30]|nr:hypothetical protein [Chroococcidiopsidaceae cyanobacterium CP_BM_ER_R8_30]